MGAKANNLDTLIDNGFNVPAFVVIHSQPPQADLDTLIELTFADVEYFAVRSSADVEDGADKSFAGYFYTELGVEKNQIVNAVEKVFSSFQEYTGSVIIQEFIASEKGGVIFSDAVNGSAIINANFGLCDSVVKGWSCDEYIVDTSGSIASNIAKEKRTIQFKDGIFSEEIDSRSTLIDTEIKTLVALSKSIEMMMGCPQDIEWCIQDSEVYILQTRPITRQIFIQDELIHYDSANIAESYSGVVLPLTISFAKNAYQHVYYQLINASGVSCTKLQHHHSVFTDLVASFSGRLYYNMNNWYAMMAFLPGYQRNKGNLEGMLTSNIKHDVSLDISPNLWLKVKYPFLVVFKVSILSYKLAKYKKQVVNAIKFSKGVDIDNADITQCIEHYQELEKAILLDAHLPVENDFLLMTFYGALKKILPESELITYIQFDNTSVNQIRSIQVLSLAIKGNVDAWQCLVNKDKHEFDRVLQEDADLKSIIDEYFLVYGGRFANELKLESEDIEYNFDKFSELIQLYSHLNPQRHEKIQSPIYKGNNRYLFLFCLKQFKKYAQRREEFRLLRSNIFSTVRRVFVRAGVSLKQKQLLDDERDVFYLTLDELRKFSELSSQYKSIVSNRKQKYTQYNIDNLPSYFSINQGENPAQQVNNSGNGRIQGRVSTPGTIRGRVRVFEKFEMPNKIDFDIMVAKFTDPGWTPLIGISKGMIIEHGGMLSHASIVSRELGIPTIIGVTGATRVLKTGQMVEINGSTGQIEIIN